MYAERQIHPVATFSDSQQGVPGAEQGWHQRRPLLLPVISISDARVTYVPATVVQSPFGPLFPSLCVIHVEPRNVFDTGGKPSDLPAEPYPT